MIILLLSSSGIRVGALPELCISHLTKLEGGDWGEDEHLGIFKTDTLESDGLNTSVSNKVGLHLYICCSTFKWR